MIVVKVKQAREILSPSSPSLKVLTSQQLIPYLVQCQHNICAFDVAVERGCLGVVAVQVVERLGQPQSNAQAVRAAQGGGFDVVLRRKT